MGKEKHSSDIGLFIFFLLFFGSGIVILIYNLITDTWDTILPAIALFIIGAIVYLVVENK